MRSITIKGNGKSSKSPDLVIINISTHIIKEELDEALDSMDELTNKLKNSFANIGFNEDDLKTLKFDIKPQYKHIEKGIINKEYKNVFAGFRIRHNLKLEFDFDNTKISDALNCLKNFDEDLEFNLVFSVKDKESMKKEVLINATENARFNAEILAEASSSKLGDLLKIEYNWVDFNFVSDTRFDYDYDYDTYDDVDYAPAVNYRMANITPDEIEISDTVTFVWELI